MTSKAALPLIALCLLTGAAHGQSSLASVVDTKRFFIPGQGEQVDVNISIIGASLQWAANAHGFQQAHVDALTMLLRNDSIIDFRKTDVASPERTDTLRSDFVHQEHFLLKPGNYTLSIELHDAGVADTSIARSTSQLIVPARTSDISFSDVLLLAPGTKTGTVPVPFAGNYYPAEVNEIAFLTEIYNTDKTFGKDSSFVLSYQLENFETHQVKSSFARKQRAKAAPVVQTSASLPINDLPSGNYTLAFEVRDRNNKLISRQEQIIQRNNPIKYDMNAVASADVSATFVDLYTDPDTLAEFIASLRPISEDLERRMIDDRWKDRDLKLMQRFFFTFWYNRNGTDPAGAWDQYRKQVVLANKMYGCRNKRGYESDQGYVFLKYGAPNTVTDGSNDMSSIPYQIWHFYHAGKYSDKHFVFWQPERATACWTLLHSDVYGELKNPHWNQMLHEPSDTWSPADRSTTTPTESGVRLDDIYNHPH